jgi:hypothetical protein
VTHLTLELDLPEPARLAHRAASQSAIFDHFEGSPIISTDTRRSATPVQQTLNISATCARLLRGSNRVGDVHHNVEDGSLFGHRLIRLRLFDD